MTEKEYIERGEIIRRIKLRIDDYNRDFNSFAPKMVLAYKELLNMVEYLPTADVQEVRHGKWIYVNEDLDWADCKCSECGYTDLFENCTESFYNFCPECGAKMDKE